MKWRYRFFTVLTAFLLTTFSISAQPLLANNSSVATPTDLVAAINSANSNPDMDTIILTADISLTAAAESSADYGNSGLPAITSDITIEGQGHWLLNYNASGFRFLRVASTGTLTLYNISLGAGHATAGTTTGGCGNGISCGGSILSEGTLNLTHTGLISNVARDGGGLYILNGTANIYDSSFSQNSGDMSNGHGGAIYFKSGNLNIHDSVFSDNQSAAGGGIYFLDGVETIDRTTFSNNRASFAGGGIANNNGTGTITGSTFSNNSADVGGAITQANGVQVSNSTFSGNKATSGGGGAYFVAGSGSIIFRNTTFSGNIAPIGGGIFSTNAQSLTFQNSIIRQSSTGANCAISGGTFTADAANLADDASCTGFTNLSNPAQNLNIGSLADNGGSTKTFAINQPGPALDSSSATCSSFDQRGAGRVGNCDVGAFEAGGGIRTLQFSTSASSVPTGTSGTVQVPIILDSTLYQADTVKAYIWVSGGTAVAGVDYVPFGVQVVSIAPNEELATVNVTMLNSAPTTDKTIILSFAMQNGPGFSGATRLGMRLTHTITLFGTNRNGQIYSAGTASELVNAITSANSADGTDTILLTSDISLTAKADTSSDYGDSGLPAITSAITIEGQGHSITRNANAPNFRIIRVTQSGLLTLNNVTVSSGKTSISGFHYGGGILSEGAFILNNSSISANTADYGGGLSVIYGTANIHDSTITNNTTTPNGLGAGLTLLVGNLSIVDSVISNNISSGNGGGIYVDADAGNIVIDHSTIGGNKASNTGGGMIFGNSTGSALITNSTFVGNSANSGGGAALAGPVYLSNSTFSENSATSSGGGIYLSGYVVPMVVNHVTVVGNTAPAGGGIYAFDQSSLITLSDSIVIQSTTGSNCSILPNTFAATGTNFADDASCNGFTNVPGSTLNIGALADNGGNTQTYAINDPSPALDSSTGTCGDFDQRGVVRGLNTSGAVDAPQAGDCDVGAFEAGSTIPTLEFADADSTASIQSTTHQVLLKLDHNLVQADAVKAYVWVNGGTAVAGVDYAPFGVQTVTIAPGSSSASVQVALLDSTARADKTIILSIATQNGPGFSGPVHLGTQLTHTVTTSELETTPEPTPQVTPEPTDLPNAAPTRNYFTTKTPTLTWNAVTGTDHYEIQISVNSAFISTITYDAGNRLSFTWPSALANDSYFWRVRACSGKVASTCGVWSAVDTFVVKAP